MQSNETFSLNVKYACLIKELEEVNIYQTFILETLQIIHIQFTVE